MHQRPMVPVHGTQYKENPPSHHGGMHMDGLMDWTLSHHVIQISNYRCLLISLPKHQVSSLLDTAFFLLESEKPWVVKTSMVPIGLQFL